MIYRVPVYYEVVEIIEVDLPENTNPDKIREKALEKFQETPVDLNRAEFIDGTEETDPDAPIYTE